VPPEETVPVSEARAFETGCLRHDDTLRNLIAEVRGVLDSKEDIRDQLDLIGDILDRAEAAEAARNARDARVTGEAA
jgi:ABC-type Fe3+-hydroxamate transport system substrate-binding protein